MRYVRVQAGYHEYHSGIQTAVLVDEPPLVDEPAFNAPVVVDEAALVDEPAFNAPVDEPAFNAPPAVLGELAVLGNGRFQPPAECVALYRIRRVIDRATAVCPTTTLRRVERFRRWF